MKFIAKLRTVAEIERPVQTIHPTRERAIEWAQKIMKLSSDYVEIFEIQEILVDTIHT